MRYTYTRRSDTRLKEIRRNTSDKMKEELITEILELRRSVNHWRSLAHVSVGGKRV